jgi:hypothetical protein
MINNLEHLKEINISISEHIINTEVVVNNE